MFQMKTRVFILLMGFGSFSFTQIAPKIDFELVVVPAGTFTMGSVDKGSLISEENEFQEVDGVDVEIRHKVTLSAFKVSKKEVTFAQYDKFCEATGRKKPSDEGWGRGNRPGKMLKTFQIGRVFDCPQKLNGNTHVDQEQNHYLILEMI